MEKTLEKEQEIRARIDQFFTQIIAGNSSDAFAELLKGSPLGANQEEIGRIVKDTEDMLKTSGRIHSKELLRISRLGSRLIRFTYLSYSDDNPLRWEVFAYLGKSGWQILTFSVNNRIAELFDDPITRRVGSITP